MLTAWLFSSVFFWQGCCPASSDKPVELDDIGKATHDPWPVPLGCSWPSRPRWLRLAGTFTNHWSESWVTLWLRSRQQVAFKCPKFFLNKKKKQQQKKQSVVFSNTFDHGTLSPRKERERKRKKGPGSACSLSLRLRAPPAHSLFGRTHTQLVHRQIICWSNRK